MPEITKYFLSSYKGKDLILGDDISQIRFSYVRQEPEADFHLGYCVPVGQTEFKYVGAFFHKNLVLWVPRDVVTIMEDELYTYKPDLEVIHSFDRRVTTVALCLHDKDGPSDAFYQPAVYYVHDWNGVIPRNVSIGVKDLTSGIHMPYGSVLMSKLNLKVFTKWSEATIVDWISGVKKCLPQIHDDVAIMLRHHVDNTTDLEKLFAYYENDRGGKGFVMQCRPILRNLAMQFNGKVPLWNLLLLCWTIASKHRDYGTGSAKAFYHMKDMQELFDAAKQ